MISYFVVAVIFLILGSLITGILRVRGIVESYDAEIILIAVVLASITWPVSIPLGLLGLLGMGIVKLVEYVAGRLEE